MKKKVLVAENNPEILGYLKDFLVFLGEFEIQQVQTSVELLAAVNALEPELVIIDLNAMKVNAQELFQEIKKNPSVQILAITVRKGEEKILKSQGASEVLNKPVDLTELSEKVKKILHPSEEDKKPEYARLLIADDETELSGFLKEFFERQGIDVYTAADGEEAFEVFKEKKCNLVLLDIKMPKKSGLELIPLLEKSENPPAPKAIWIITAGLAETTSELNRHEHPVLDKPLDLEVLRKKIFEVCEKYSFALRKETDKSLKAPD